MLFINKKNYKIYQKWFYLSKIANKKKSEKIYRKAISLNPLSSFPFIKLFHIATKTEDKIDLLIKALHVNPKDNIAYNYLYFILKKLNYLSIIKKSSIYFNIIDDFLNLNFYKINKKQKFELENLDNFLCEHSPYSISLKLFYSSQRAGEIYCISKNGKVDLDDRFQGELLDFILDKNNNLIIGSIHKLLSNCESFVHGAGRIKIIQNKIVYIDNWSGHYRPTLSEFYNTLGLLGANGYDLSFSKALNYEYIIKKEMNIHKKKYLDTFHQKIY